MATVAGMAQNAREWLDRIKARGLTGQDAKESLIWVFENAGLNRDGAIRAFEVYADRTRNLGRDLDQGELTELFEGEVRAGRAARDASAAAGANTYSDPNNRFTFGLNSQDLAGNESDFDAMSRVLLGNFEQQQGASIAAPIRRRYRELADRLSTLFDLEKASGDQFDTPRTLGDFFQSLSTGRGNAYSASQLGSGKALLNRVVGAYNGGNYDKSNATASALFGDSDDAQRRQFEAVIDAMSSDVAPHLRSALRDTLADDYGRYRGQGASQNGTGNLFTFLKALGRF